MEKVSGDSDHGLGQRNLSQFILSPKRGTSRVTLRTCELGADCSVPRGVSHILFIQSSGCFPTLWKV